MNKYEIPYTSIPSLAKDQAEKLPNKKAFGYKKNGEYTYLTFQQYYYRVLLIARSLLALNLKKGTKVAILSENRIEWVISDMGALCAGLVTVPIYPSNTVEQIEYVLKDSGSEILFVSSQTLYEKVASGTKKSKLKKVISFDKLEEQKALPVENFSDFARTKEVLKDSEKEEIEECFSKITHDDLLTLIYTSGTTAGPKGVMLSHGNILYDSYYGVKKVAVLDESDIFLSFLPLSHAFERSIGYYLPIMTGSLVCYAESIETLLDDIQKVNPTVMIGVPRFFEKFYSKIQDTISQMPTAKQSLISWAFNVGDQYIQKKVFDKESTGFIGLQYKLAEKLVFKKMKEKFGTQARFFVSGGAPLDKKIIEFFWAIGLPILEGFGLTETSPAIAFNNFERIRLGSVGTLFQHMNARIADDGELEVQGPAVMQGYYNNKKATSEAIQDDWFKTGDIARIDEDGFIFITDRKKEVIIIAGGENIPPQPMEKAFKKDPFIAQAIIIGDQKPYLVALIVPDFERLQKYAKKHRIHFSSNEELVKHPSIREMMDERKEKINLQWPSYQTIKKISILGEEFTVENDELTPTTKLKRRIILDHYQQVVDDFYNS